MLRNTHKNTCILIKAGCEYCVLTHPLQYNITCDWRAVTCMRPSPVLKHGSLTKSVSFRVNWCHNLSVKNTMCVKVTSWSELHCKTTSWRWTNVPQKYRSFCQEINQQALSDISETDFRSYHDYTHVISIQLTLYKTNGERWLIVMVGDDLGICKQTENLDNTFYVPVL